MKTFVTPALLALCLAAPLLAAEAEKTEKEQILESGSFEWPPVIARRLRSEGADISKSALNAEWITFKDKTDDEGGQLRFGLTNEISRTGRQCMYVEFNKLTKPSVVAELSSDFITILPGQSYRVGIWGRMDKERPITLDQRLPYLRLRVDWFKIDEEQEHQQVGDVEQRMQPIPGPLKRKPLFVPGKWSPFFVDLKAPEDATLIKITWAWVTTAQAGETDGMIYFDDAILEGKPAPKVDPFADEPEEKDDDAPATAPGAKPEAPKAGAPASPAPAAPEKPAAPKEPKIELTPVR